MYYPDSRQIYRTRNETFPWRKFEYQVIAFRAATNNSFRRFSSGGEAHERGFAVPHDGSGKAHMKRTDPNSQLNVNLSALPVRGFESAPTR